MRQLNPQFIEDSEAVAAFIGGDEKRATLQSAFNQRGGDGGNAGGGFPHVMGFDGEVDVNAGWEPYHRGGSCPRRSVSMNFAAGGTWLASVIARRKPPADFDALPSV